VTRKEEKYDNVKRIKSFKDFCLFCLLPFLLMYFLVSVFIRDGFELFVSVTNKFVAYLFVLLFIIVVWLFIFK